MTEKLAFLDMLDNGRVHYEKVDDAKFRGTVIKVASSLWYFSVAGALVACKPA